MQIKFVDQHGIIRNTLPAEVDIETIKRIGQNLANKHQLHIRAIKGGLTKLASFDPAR